jgi:hypothetical protein
MCVPNSFPYRLYFDWILSWIMKSAFRFTFFTVVVCFSSIVAASGTGGIGVAGGYFGAFLL